MGEKKGVQGGVVAAAVVIVVAVNVWQWIM